MDFLNSSMKEISLSLKLLVSGQEVPEKMKTKALGQIELLIANHEEGDAEYYLLDLLYQGLKNNDMEKIDLLIQLVDDDDGEAISESKKADMHAISSIGARACKKFCEEREPQARAAIVHQLFEHGIFPMYYDDGFMLVYMFEISGFAVVSINGLWSKDQLIEKLDNMPSDEKARIYGLVHEITGIDCVDVEFASLSYTRYAEDQMTLKIQRLK